MLLNREQLDYKTNIYPLHNLSSSLIELFKALALNKSNAKRQNWNIWFFQYRLQIRHFFFFFSIQNTNKSQGESEEALLLNTPSLEISHGKLQISFYLIYIIFSHKCYQIIVSTQFRRNFIFFRFDSGEFWRREVEAILLLEKLVCSSCPYRPRFKRSRDCFCCRFLVILWRRVLLFWSEIWILFDCC